MKRTAGTTWDLHFILPNLNPKEPYEADPFCICSGRDLAQRRLQRSVPNTTARKLLDSYRTVFGDQYVPGVLLARADAPTSLYRGDAVRDFRNICAFATIERCISALIVDDQT